MTAVLAGAAKLLVELRNAGIANATPSSTEPARRGTLRSIDLISPTKFIFCRPACFGAFAAESLSVRPPGVRHRPQRTPREMTIQCSTALRPAASDHCLGARAIPRRQ